MNIERNEINGFTLVEVLASIVILSILLISFLLIFLQTMKTTNTSEDIIDYTYIAQTEMEKVYELTKEPYTDRNNAIATIGYSHVGEEDGWESLTMEASDDQVLTKISWKIDEDEEGTMESPLTKFRIQVFDKNDLAKPKVQMENWLEWKADTNE